MTDDVRRTIAAEAARMVREGDEPRAYSRVSPPKQPSQVYSVRIPVDRLEELRQVARERRQNPSTLLRDWVLARLSEEIGGPGPSIVLAFPGGQRSERLANRIVESPLLAV